MCCIMKYGLFVTNLVFSLAGLGLLGLGIAVVVQVTELTDLVPAGITTIPITLLVVGGFIFVTALLGCCGAIRENRCFLMLYAIIIFVLAAGKTYVAVATWRAVSSIRESVVEWLGDAFANPEMREPFHVMETAFRCCGTTGAAAYEGPLPVSCCPDDVACGLATAYGGCNDRIGTFAETYGQAIGAVVIIVIAVELILAAFTICFCTSITKSSTAKV
ncbi:tetraspanin-9-like [Aricia agestis]|uniref:tetraspanin-9-like n=1 Tax=Aricia agestis TaxID=91739 RepID=UPI001C207611|nr:tetraspanin-9-like [Aricia agestis]